MPIPNARSAIAPPPLPPPRFIPDLAHGHDAGWKFANEERKGAFQKSTLAPIKQGSSLHGGYMQPRLNTRSVPEQQPEQLEVDESDRKSGTASTLPSPSQPDEQMGSLGATKEDRQKAASPSSIANQRCVYLSFVSVYVTSRSLGIVRLLPAET